METGETNLVHVILISYNTEVTPYTVYPLGMAIIANALIQAGHTVQQLDCLASPDFTVALAEAIESCPPDAIGISLRNIDNGDIFTSKPHWSISAFKNFVAFIKEHTKAPIILGGAGFSLMPKAILDHSQADYGLIGEGEELICSIIADIEAKREIPRLSKGASPLHSKGISGAHYDQGLLNFYSQKSGVVNIQTKRGCSKSCAYCSYPVLEGRTIRTRDHTEVIDEIRTLQQSVNFKEIFFVDSVFNDNQGNWLNFVEAMASAGVSVPWTAFFQPENITTEALRLCKKTGLKAIEFGTDACSNATLKAMQKGFTFDSALHCTELCVELKIPCMHFVIVGGPGESPETLKEGLQNLEQLPQSLVAVFLGVRILPDTPIHKLAIREGVLSDQLDLLVPQLYFSPYIQQEQADSMIRESFRRNKLRLYPPSEGDFRMNFLQKHGYRGILWDTMIRF